MQLIEQAKLYSRAAHQAVAQKRKYTGEPYYLHPAAVAERVAQVPGATADMIAAAYLHDVVEDTHVAIEEISALFGEKVAGFVHELTDQFVDPEIGNRSHRKALERERMSGISAEAQTIKYADLIDNTGSIVARDPGFARLYMSEKQALLNVMTDGCLVLRKEALALVTDYFKKTM